MTAIEKLHDILKDEYTASLLYGLFSAGLSNNEIAKLGEKFLEESKEERQHAKDIEDRLFLLGETPAVAVDSKEKYNESPLAIIKTVIRLETGAVKKYQELYDLAIKDGDPATADLALDHLKDEEQHLNWAEGQMFLISKIGEALWLQKWV